MQVDGCKLMVEKGNSWSKNFDGCKLMVEKSKVMVEKVVRI